MTGASPILAMSCWSCFTECHQCTHCEQWESSLDRDFSQQESLANVWGLFVGWVFFQLLEGVIIKVVFQRP